MTGRLAAAFRQARALLPVVVLPLLAVPAAAQRVPPGPLPPESDALLYVRLSGPAGMMVTFHRGQAQGQTRTAPFTIGLRPGYIYRVQIGGMARFPELAFFPSLEVRGSLRCEHCFNPADHPVPLTFTEDDFRASGQESLVTKAVVLERPELALPLASRAEQPIELQVPAGQDPVAEAGQRGRVLLIVRLGQREWSDAELASQSLPGTVLLPGEKALAQPPLPPWFPWQCVPVMLYDPIHGPEPASAEMCIPDGGDAGLPAGYDVEGRLRGLDPSDTVAEYADSQGRRRIAVSNRVCICVPRFLVYRGETRPAIRLALAGPEGARVVQAGSLLHAERAPLVERQQEHAEGVGSRQRPSEAETRLGPAVFGQLEGLNIVGTVRGPGTVTAACKGAEEAPPELPLLLIKWPDRCAALIGDVITFFLRYRNQGGRPITNVVVSDSLAARYEFIPDSNRSDRPHTFTTQPNEDGSLILRWQINDPLLPGESGTVSFQVRVR
jgi:uncharacterized repeat protein (TIGR01451 family)